MMHPLPRATTGTYHSPATRPARSGSATLKLFAVVLIVGVAAATGFATIPAEAQGVTAALGGTVKDGDGAPLAGVQVILKRQVSGSTWLYHERTTGENGAYSFSGLEPGTWNASFRMDGYRSHTEEVALTVGETKTADAELLALNTYRYRGTVKDGENNQAIQGAIVRISSWNEGGMQTREATTDADGAFSLRLFSTENSISITKGGFGTYHDYVWGTNQDVVRDIQLHRVPPQSAVIQGRVVDEAGNPVQAYISLSPDWNRGGSSGGGMAEPAYAMPDMWWPGGENYNSTVTNADGTFTMHAYTGNVVLEANRAGYLVSRLSIALRDGTQEVTFELKRLPERTVTLAGVVTDARSGDPVAGAGVSVQVPAAGDYAYATTDQNGRFEVKVRPGYTLVEVHHWGHVYYAEVVEDSAAPDSEMPNERPKPTPSSGSNDGPRYHPAALTLTTRANSTERIEIGLERRPEPTTTLTGYVVDATTQVAIAHARVSMQNHDTGEWGEAVTDEDGSYRFRANAGYHSIRVWMEGYLPFSSNVKVQASGTQRVDLLVTPGEWVHEGWWSPDGHHSDGGPRPMTSEGMMSAPAMNDAAERSTAASSSPAGFRGDGPQSIEGGGGGLGPYSPMSDGQTIPAPGLFVAILALAALGAALRRRTA